MPAACRCEAERQVPLEDAGESVTVSTCSKTFMLKIIWERRESTKDNAQDLLGFNFGKLLQMGSFQVNQLLVYWSYKLRVHNERTVDDIS